MHKCGLCVGLACKMLWVFSYVRQSFLILPIHYIRDYLKCFNIIAINTEIKYLQAYHQNPQSILG